MHRNRRPKIRVVMIKNGKFAVAAGETIRFVRSSADGNTTCITLPHLEIFVAIARGRDLLIDDGRLWIRVTGIGNDHINAKVINGSTISNRIGVRLHCRTLNIE